MNLKRVKTALPRKAGRHKAGVTMSTRWGRAVKAAAAAAPDFRPLPEYPRPQLVRAGNPAGDASAEEQDISTNWVNLNGWWEYAFGGKTRPEQWDGQILVPFSPEAPLSGVDRQLKPDETLWYRRTIRMEEEPKGRWLLHFGAVDQHCRVYLNGTEIGRHTGGYLPFTIEMTKTLREGDNVLELSVRDVSEYSFYTRGKQKIARGGMFYTAQSGIWQTVWMEHVSDSYIRNVKIVPDGDAFRIDVWTHVTAAADVAAELFEPVLHADGDASKLCAGQKSIGSGVAHADEKGHARMLIRAANPKRWSPDEPWLYGIRIECGDDAVYSYGALREVSVGLKEGGYRLCLNGKPCFMNGVLDQGYWPESLMTPPADEALIHDITEMKRLGFNMLRKHCKLEADRFYFHCDRLGMLVWQDMVNGGSGYNMPRLCYLPTFFPKAFGQKTDTTAWDYRRTGRQNPKSRKLWLRESRATVLALRNHPSIVLWGLFNEGWGQFDSAANAERIRALDPTRLIDAASGWFDQGAGDLRSVHNYFRKLEVESDENRAFGITEYGGFSLLAEGNAWNEEVYGYGMMQTFEQLRERYETAQAEIQALVPAGLSAAVYTQVSDIEDECNGLLTYDREYCKVELSESD